MFWSPRPFPDQRPAESELDYALRCVVFFQAEQRGLKQSVIVDAVSFVVVIAINFVSFSHQLDVGASFTAWLNAVAAEFLGLQFVRLMVTSRKLLQTQRYSEDFFTERAQALSGLSPLSVAHVTHAGALEE